MKLDQTLMNEPPILNPVVEGAFKHFPVYVKQEFLPAHRYSLHVQPGIEINLTHEGKGAYVIGKQIYMQTPGQLIIFSGNTPHQLYVDPSSHYKRTVICYEQNLFLKGSSGTIMPDADFGWFSALDCSHLQLKPGMFSQIKWIVSLMAEEMMKKESGWQHVIGSQLISLAALIRRSMEEVNSGESDSAGAARMDPVSLCCEYIDKHLYEDLSLQNMARMFHVSPEHLTRQFKKEKGFSFYQYVLQQRVYESRRMLIECPGMTLTDIAYAVGFTSSAQFSRVFKSLTLKSPTQFRSEAQKQSI